VGDFCDPFAFEALPRDHWRKLPRPRTRTAQPRDRPPHRRGRHFFPDDRFIRLAGRIVIEQNDEWLVSGATSPSKRSREATETDRRLTHCECDRVLKFGDRPTNGVLPSPVHMALLPTNEDRAKALVDWAVATFTHQRAGRFTVESR
jgi:hypothetical protein